MNKKVSVIIPMYNSEKYIKQCIETVINQTYKDLEIIVIDDGSSDSSCEIVNSFKDDRIMMLNLESNSGVSFARNRGIDYATGDYICFIDSDDMWVEDKIEQQTNFMINNEYEFIYSDYVFFKDKFLEDMAHNKRVVVPRSITYEQAIKNTTIFLSTVMFDASKIKKEDMYMPDMKIGQDTAVWWHILKNGVVAHGINKVLAGYRVSGKSLSSNKIKAVKGAWKLYKRENLTFIKRAYCFSCYIKNAIKRRI